jgi:hypothetical protein
MNYATSQYISHEVDLIMGTIPNVLEQECHMFTCHHILWLIVEYTRDAHLIKKGMP